MRHELKFIITPVQYHLLRSRIRPFLRQDENAGEDGDYFIRSIYFDSWQYRGFHEKNMGIDSRKKYRLRFYNGDATYCSLECKQKKGTRIKKQSIRLSKEEVDLMLTGESQKILEENGQISNLLTELALLMKGEGFRPQVVVDYLREAYVYPISNVRITFDKQLAAGTITDCMTKQRCMPHILPDGNMILEVKYDEYLPEHISQILASIRPVQTAASKYVMCMNEKLEGRIL